LGKPVAGRVRVESHPGRRIPVSPCPDLRAEPTQAEEEPTPGTVSVQPDGEFCFLAETATDLIVAAEADHFLPVRHDIEQNASQKVSRPRFREAPATIDLFEEQNYVVELLTGADEDAPIDAKISLSLRCEGAFFPIDQAPLQGNQLLRFELGELGAVTPGSCQFVAETMASAHPALTATRGVLVRDQVLLHLEDLKHEEHFVHLEVTARGTRGAPDSLSQGLIEARLNDAFLALSPLQNGRALLELKRETDERIVELVYIPATPSLLPGETLMARVPGKPQGFRWASIHTIGLLLFAFWLGYAWLKPSARAEPSKLPPPRKAVLEESGKRTGPLSGEVRDAHTGASLPGIQLILEAVGAASTTELEKVHSDEGGRFRFETRLEAHPMLRVIASGGAYMSLASKTRAVHVTVHLTERRRALVQNLVSWAKTLGPPWYRRTAPTPGRVEQIAREVDRPDAQTWAHQVAAAAYAPEPPNEEEVLALREPKKEPLDH
jgi:hypothetical protein